MMGAGMRIVLFGDANSVNVQRWREGLAHAGAEVYLLSIHIDAPKDTFTLPIPIPKLPRLPEKLRYFTAVPAARRLLNQLQPDLVIGYFVTGYGTLAALSGFRPLVQVTAGDDVLIAPKHPLLGRLVGFNLRRADLIAAWAPHMAEAVHALGIPEAKVFILPRGIPLQAYENAAQSQAEGEPIRIISTRSLYAVYRIDALLCAVHLLRQRGVDCRLTIAGDGPERELLIAKAGELGLTDITEFTGQISNDLLPNVLLRHDLYVSAIRTDGVSASLLEAMAAGVFPIVYDNAANRYWIEPGKNGLLLTNDAPETLANTIQQAAGNVALRRQVWHSNRALVFERGDLLRNTATYLAKFTELVARSGSHASETA